MNILWVGAHPDDMEFFVAGTLGKYIRQGHKVSICVAARGDKGSHTLSPNEIAKIREEETVEGAKLLGAEFLGILGYPDCEVYFDRDLVGKMVDVIRKAKPNVIITHYDKDYMPDHNAVSQATVAAAFHAGLTNFETQRPPHKPAKVYYSDTLYGLDFDPDFWVDITDTFELKMRALRAHKSQVEDFMPGHFLASPEEAAQIWSRFRGLQVGVKYAEAFKLVKRHMRLTSINLPE